MATCWCKAAARPVAAKPCPGGPSLARGHRYGIGFVNPWTSNGPRGAGHRLRRVPPDTFSPCRDSTSDGDVADRSIQWVSPASARVSCAFAVPRGTGTDEARHVADWTRGLARSENPAPPLNLSLAAALVGARRYRAVGARQTPRCCAPATGTATGTRYEVAAGRLPARRHR